MLDVDIGCARENRQPWHAPPIDKLDQELLKQRKQPLGWLAPNANIEAFFLVDPAQCAADIFVPVEAQLSTRRSGECRRVLPNGPLGHVHGCRRAINVRILATTVSLHPWRILGG